GRAAGPWGARAPGGGGRARGPSPGRSAPPGRGRPAAPPCCRRSPARAGPGGRCLPRRDVGNCRDGSWSARLGPGVREERLRALPNTRPPGDCDKFLEGRRGLRPEAGGGEAEEAVSGHRWAIHPQELVTHVRAAGDRLIDTEGKGGAVGVRGTDDDATVNRCPDVEEDEVPTVVGHHGTSLTDGERQDGRVANFLLRLAGLLRGQHVMSEPSQLLDDREVEVLVGIKKRHASGFLVLPDGLLDLLSVLLVIRPRGVQVALGQRGEALQNLSVREAEFSPLHQPVDTETGGPEACI